MCTEAFEAGGTVTLVERDLELLQYYLDGGLPPEPAAALVSRLNAEPILAEGLIRLARQEAVVKEWARSQADSGLKKSAALPVPRAQRWRRLAAIAAALLLVVVLLARPRNTETQALAQLEDVHGEVYVLTDA